MKMPSWPANLFLLLLCLVLLAEVATPQTAPPPSVDRRPRTGCKSKCGNVNITYPFGIDSGCFRRGFEINCTSDGTPYLGLGSNIEVVDIQLLQGIVVVNHDIARDCYYHNGSQPNNYVPSINIISLPNYKFSTERNSFVAIGCDTEGYIWSYRVSTFWTGCLSYCTNASFVPNHTCSGIGCCTAPIPKDLRNFSLLVESFYNHSYSIFAPCSYAFLADVGKLDFTLSSFAEYTNREKAPVTLDWAIMGQTCEQSNGTDDFACVSPNSNCSNSINGPGYLCNCSQGFQGNPYLDDSNGCSDIDECKADTSPCVKRCQNREGSYSCSCPWYMYGDGRRDGSGCRSILRILYLSLGNRKMLYVPYVLSSLINFFRFPDLLLLKQNGFDENVPVRKSLPTLVAVSVVKQLNNSDSIVISQRFHS